MAVEIRLREKYRAKKAGGYRSPPGGRNQPARPKVAFLKGEREEQQRRSRQSMRKLKITATGRRTWVPMDERNDA